MQRYVNDVKADISREMELDELRKLRSTVEDTARSIEQSVQKGLSDTENELNRVAESVQTDTEPGAASDHGAEKPPVEREPAADSAPPQADPPPGHSADVSTRRPA